MENKKMGIFTLRNKEDGNRGKVLNGKIFYVKVESPDCIGGKMYFIDIASGNILWMTTKIEEKIPMPDGVKLKTRNHVYDLVSLDSLVPSNDRSDKHKNDDNDEKPLAEQCVLNDLAIKASENKNKKKELAKVKKEKAIIFA